MLNYYLNLMNIKRLRLVNSDISRLCRRLHYSFNDEQLLKQALTHCSMGSSNYERLEFLGDSILSFIIAHELYQRFPAQTEGQLSRMRSYLVKGERLAEIAQTLQLGDYLILGQGELKSGGFRRASILADALEAVFAAIFLDKGMAEVKRVIITLYQPHLADKALMDALKDNKTQLQEYVQSLKMALPRYELTHIEGEEHAQIFHIRCNIQGLSEYTQASATTRRKAEQLTAKMMLSYLKTKVH